jgi:spore maturation protein CgeD
MKRALPTFRCGGLTFRPLSAADLPVTRGWRNQQRVREQLLHSDEITEAEHQEWFDRYQYRDNDFVFVVSDEEGPVGQVAIYNVDWAQKAAEFGRLMIGEKRGLGRNYGMILTLGAVDWAFSSLQLRKLCLNVKRGNSAAVETYLRSGFVHVGLPQDDLFYMEAQAGPERAWERWDNGEVVEQIRQQWQSADEQAHRAWLAMEIGNRVRQVDALHSAVLEVGCGTGEVAQALVAAWQTAQQELKYIGVDVSRRMLAWAVRTNDAPRLKFGYEDLLGGTPSMFYGGSSDVVICCEVLGHLPEARTALQRLLARTGAHGQLFVSLWLGEQEQITTEQFESSRFLHHVYAEREIYQLVREMSPDALIEPIRGPHTTLLHIDQGVLPVTHTVILGSYNRPKLVREAIRSVRDQTDIDWELIITDDGSDPETLEAIQAEIDTTTYKCILLRGTGPTGPRPDAQVRAVRSINRALPLARGELIHYLPDDDFYPRDRLTLFRDWFEAHPEQHMAYGRMSWVFADGSLQGRDLFPGGPVEYPCGQLDHTSVVHRRSCLRKVTMWPEAGINYDSDGVFFRKLVEEGFGPIHPMDQVVAFHRDHGYNLIATQGNTGSKREP